MFIMITTATLCAALLIVGLVALACRHRSELWIVSDDAILIVVSPVVILLGTFGAVSLGWRMTHGGLAAIPIGGWIGAAVIAAVSTVVWHLVAPRIRRAGRAGAPGAAAAAAQPVSTPL